MTSLLMLTLIIGMRYVRFLHCNIFLFWPLFILHPLCSATLKKWWVMPQLKDRISTQTMIYLYKFRFMGIYSLVKVIIQYFFILFFVNYSSSSHLEFFQLPLYPFYIVLSLLIVFFLCISFSYSLCFSLCRIQEDYVVCLQVLVSAIFPIAQDNFIGD